jgi:hypothetical protein
MVGVTGFVGRSDNDQAVDPLTPEALRELLLAARELVLVEDRTRGDHFFAQALRLNEEIWRVEVHADDGGLWTEAANTDAAFDILRSWAAGDGWWEGAFSWTRVRAAPT